MFIGDCLNADQFSSPLRDMITLESLAAAVLRPEFLHGSPLAHAVFSGKEEIIPLCVDLHADYFVIFIQINGFDTGCRAPHGAGIRLMEADAHSLRCHQEDIVVGVGLLDIDELVVLPEINGDDPYIADIVKGAQGSLFDDPPAGRHEQVVFVLILIHDRNDGRDLFLRQEIEEVYDRRSSGHPAGLRDLVGLEAVGASEVGEEHDGVMGPGHEQVGDIIVVQSLHALDTAAAPALHAEIVLRHALDVTQGCPGNDDIFVLDQVLHLEVLRIRLDTAAAFVPVLVRDNIDLIFDHGKEFFGVGEDLFELFDPLQEILVFLLQLLSFQTCQSSQAHIHNSLGLDVVQTKPLGQARLGGLYIGALPDDPYDFIYIVEGDEQSLQDMVAFLRLVEVISCPAGDDILLVVEVIGQHLQQVHDLGLVVDQGQHGDAEGILHLGVLEEPVQDDIGIGVVPQLDDDPHTFPVGLIPQVGDALDLLVLDELRDLLDQVGFIDQIGEFCDDDAVFAVVHRLYVRHGAGDHLAFSGHIGLNGSGGAHDDPACGKIRRLDDGQDLGDLRIPVLLYFVVYDLCDARHYLPQIVGRNVCRHTDSDTGRAVYQEVGEAAGQDRGFFLRFVKVGDKSHSVLAYVREHLHGDLCQAGLRITHSRGAVSVHTAEISVPVHKGIAHGPGLRHVDQRPVDRGVAVRVILTHRIADNTRAFSVRLVRSVIELAHRIQNTPLNGFQAVADIRKRALRDHAHGVIDIRALHCLFQVYVLYTVKNSVVHAFPRCTCMPALSGL